MDSHLPSTSKRHQLERYGRDGAGSHNEALIKDIENTGTRPDVLLTLGRIPVLQRNYGFLSIVGFSCTLLISWVAVLTGFDISIPKYVLLY